MFLQKHCRLQCTTSRSQSDTSTSCFAALFLASCVGTPPQPAAVVAVAVPAPHAMTTAAPVHLANCLTRCCHPTQPKEQASTRSPHKPEKTTNKRNKTKQNKPRQGKKQQQQQHHQRLPHPTPAAIPSPHQVAQQHLPSQLLAPHLQALERRGAFPTRSHPHHGCLWLLQAGVQLPRRVPCPTPGRTTRLHTASGVTARRSGAKHAPRTTDTIRYDHEQHSGVRAAPHTHTHTHTHTHKQKKRVKHRRPQAGERERGKKGQEKEGTRTQSPGGENWVVHPTAGVVEAGCGALKLEALCWH